MATFNKRNQKPECDLPRLRVQLRLVTGFHKSVEGNEKVDESIFLDFGGEFAVVHQCRADGFTRIYAKKRNFFLDFFFY